MSLKRQFHEHIMNPLLVLGTSFDASSFLKKEFGSEYIRSKFTGFTPEDFKGGYKEKIQNALDYLTKASSKKADDAMYVLDFLLRKIAMMYKFDDEERRQFLLDRMKFYPPQEATSDPLCFLHFHWHYMSMILDTCVHLYEGRFFPFHIDNRLAEYIFKNHTSESKREGIFLDLCDLVENTEIDYKSRSDAVDILLRCGIQEKVDKAKELLELLREEMEEKEFYKTAKPGEVYEKKKRHLRTFYQDAQNSHDEVLSESAKKAAIELLQEVEPGFNFDDCRYHLVKMFPQHTKVIRKVMLRLKNDTAKFDGFTLLGVFTGLFCYINKQPKEKKASLFKRLIDELIESEDYCSTGHLNRLINVLQGYDDRFAITMSLESEIYASISHHMNKELQNAENSDALLEGSATKDPLFLNFVKDKCRSKIVNLIDEYKGKDVKNDIVKAIAKYTQLKPEEVRLCPDGSIEYCIYNECVNQLNVE